MKERYLPLRKELRNHESGQSLSSLLTEAANKTKNTPYFIKLGDFFKGNAFVICNHNYKRGTSVAQGLGNDWVSQATSQSKSAPLILYLGKTASQSRIPLL